MLGRPKKKVLYLIAVPLRGGGSKAMPSRKKIPTAKVSHNSYGMKNDCTPRISKAKNPEYESRFLGFNLTEGIKFFIVEIL